MLIRTSLLIITFFLVSTISYAENELPLITVIANGSAKAQPDQAEFKLTFSTSKLEVEQARKEVDDNVAYFLKRLKKFELESQSLDSSRATIYPEYDYSNQQRQLKAYQVSRQVSFTLNQLSQLDELIKLISKSQIASLTNIQYNLSDMTLLKEEALTKALNNAQRLAQHIAQNYGVTLGKVYRVTHQVSNMAPVRIQTMSMRSEMASGPASTFKTGTFKQKDLEYKATINVAFRFH